MFTDSTQEINGALHAGILDRAGGGVMSQQNRCHRKSAKVPLQGPEGIVLIHNSL
jgi:hypothetical protein